MKDDYVIDDDGIYNYDEADYGYDNIEQTTKQCKCELNDDSDEEPSANLEHDFINDTDTEASDDNEAYMPDDFVDHSFMNY